MWAACCEGDLSVCGMVHMRVWEWVAYRGEGSLGLGRDRIWCGCGWGRYASGVGWGGLTEGGSGSGRLNCLPHTGFIYFVFCILNANICKLLV